MSVTRLHRSLSAGVCLASVAVGLIVWASLEPADLATDEASPQLAFEAEPAKVPALTSDVTPIAIRASRGGVIDLTGSPALSDQVAIELMDRVVAFSRSTTPDELGFYGTVITMDQELEEPLVLVIGDAGVIGEPTVLAGTAMHDGTWIEATTGSLDRSIPYGLASGDGGVSWTNWEAQSYDPDFVTLDGSDIVIRTEPKPVPGTDLLPFTSGMVLSAEKFGWGTFSLEVILPNGEGLWPAIWLLDAQACEAPGRCAGYDTTDYHEIDLLEARGGEPGVVHTSVHWWDQSVRSSSVESRVGVGTGVLGVELERRPGLLVWRVDGEVVHVEGGVVSDAGHGPHRAGPMQLVVNTAVGGSFAGEELVGREGHWWAEARVPASFGALSWSRAELVITKFEFRPLSRSAG